MAKIKNVMPAPKRRNKVQEALVTANKKAGAHLDLRNKIRDAIYDADCAEDELYELEEE